ncbi:RNA-splicing factor [Coemansia sp. RSA 988]|nr:RNA-splicing factor [Coemansia sp. RSA 988]
MSTEPEDLHTPALFKKSRRRGTNIRKRTADEIAPSDDTIAEEVASIVKGNVPDDTRDTKHTSSAKTKSLAPAPASALEVSDTVAGNGNVGYHFRKAMDATRTEEHGTPETSLKGSSTANNADLRVEGGDGLYKGKSAYTNRAPGTGSRRAGPVKAPVNIRTTSVFDYQPNLCKDYKETGYCGYGDSCIFLHDRGVYKTGWQLEKEFEESQSGVPRDNPKLWQTAHSDDEADSNSNASKRVKASTEQLPFACLICRKPFENPIVTKCQHYFCEACALARYRKTPKCFACGAATAGVFRKAKNLKVATNDSSK